MLFWFILHSFFCSSLYISAILIHLTFFFSFYVLLLFCLYLLIWFCLSSFFSSFNLPFSCFPYLLTIYYIFATLIDFTLSFFSLLSCISVLLPAHYLYPFLINFTSFLCSLSFLLVLLSFSVSLSYSDLFHFDLFHLYMAFYFCIIFIRFIFLSFYLSLHVFLFFSASYSCLAFFSVTVYFPDWLHIPFFLSISSLSCIYFLLTISY